MEQCLKVRSQSRDGALGETWASSFGHSFVLIQNGLWTSQTTESLFCFQRLRNPPSSQSNFSFHCCLPCDLILSLWDLGWVKTTTGYYNTAWCKGHPPILLLFKLLPVSGKASPPPSGPHHPWHLPFSAHLPFITRLPRFHILSMSRSCLLLSLLHQNLGLNYRAG